MTKKMCPKEERVRQVLISGSPDLETQKHISECPACQEVTTVATWLNQFKQRSWNTDMPKKILPDFEFFYGKASARAKTNKKMMNKALRPLIFPQVLSYGAYSVGLIFIILWGLRKFGSVINTPAIKQFLPFFFILMGMVMVSMVFCGALAGFEKRKHPVH